MKKIKRIALTLMLVLIVIFSTGCASVQYQRSVTKDGKIIDAVSVKLDNEKITQAGYNIDKVTTDVKNKMQQYLNAVISSFYNRDDGLLEIEKLAVYNNTYSVVSIQNEHIIAKLEFRNYNTFKYFYGLHLNEETDSDDNSNMVENFLYKKNITTGKTIFSGADCEFIASEFNSYFNGNFSIDDCDLSYVFGTPESKLHSDSDYTYTKDGVTYHQWIVNSVDEEITTFTYQMKPVNWYVLALILTAVLLLILFVVGYIRHRIYKWKEADLKTENSTTTNPEINTSLKED